MPINPKAGGDVESGSSEEPRPGIAQSMLSLCLTYARRIIPDLQNVPDEQIFEKVPD